MIPNTSVFNMAVKLDKFDTKLEYWVHLWVSNHDPSFKTKLSKALVAPDERGAEIDGNRERVMVMKHVIKRWVLEMHRK